MGQIYKHTSPSGKSYIGQTKLTWSLRAGNDPIKRYHSSTKFKNAIKKYGWENFTHEVLEENLSNPDELDAREKFWIEKFDSVNKGYNSLIGATGVSYPSVGNIPVKLRKVSKADLKDLYITEGYSAKEIGEMFDCSHNSVIAALQVYKIPRRPIGSPGKVERENNLLKASVEKDCVICNHPFTPSKKSVKTCSRPCRGKLASKKASESRDARTRGDKLSLVFSDERRAQHSELMKGNSNSIGNKGWIVSGHKRWHVKRNIVNAECDLCNGQSS